MGVGAADAALALIVVGAVLQRVPWTAASGAPIRVAVLQGNIGAAAKFDSRYATLGFNDTATLDEGTMWATSFALKELTADDEARIGALVKKAVS